MRCLYAASVEMPLHSPCAPLNEMSKRNRDDMPMRISFVLAQARLIFTCADYRRISFWVTLAHVILNDNSNNNNNSSNI